MTATAQAKKETSAMDLAKALAELREKRDDIDRAILSLERLANGRPRGRGRPPGRALGPAKKRPDPHMDGNRLKSPSD
jgi:hypothetical protein